MLCAGSHPTSPPPLPPPTTTQGFLAQVVPRRVLQRMLSAAVSSAAPLDAAAAAGAPAPQPATAAAAALNEMAGGPGEAPGAPTSEPATPAFAGGRAPRARSGPRRSPEGSPPLSKSSSAGSGWGSACGGSIAGDSGSEGGDEGTHTPPPSPYAGAESPLAGAAAPAHVLCLAPGRSLAGSGGGGGGLTAVGTLRQKVGAAGSGVHSPLSLPLSRAHVPASQREHGPYPLSPRPAPPSPTHTLCFFSLFPPQWNLEFADPALEDGFKLYFNAFQASRKTWHWKHAPPGIRPGHAPPPRHPHT